MTESEWDRRRAAGRPHLTLVKPPESETTLLLAQAVADLHGLVLDMAHKWDADVKLINARLDALEKGKIP